MTPFYPELRRYFQIWIWLCLCTLYSAGTQASSADRPQVLVSILPLQLLVSELMQDVAPAQLLLASSQSPHHASLRPSQIRAINRADIIFWVGPQLETFLPRVLQSSGAQDKAVALLTLPGLRTLPLRSQHQDHKHSEKHASQIDPHIWLSTDNVEIIIAEIAQQLIRLDPGHSELYQRNHENLRARIGTLRQQLRTDFKSGGRYISYHDGYQYLEQELGLQLVASVSQNDELQASVQHVRELRRRLQQQDIRCLVYDAPTRPALLATLLQGSRARAVELDALGIKLPSDERDWYSLMHRLGTAFTECLSTAKP